MMESLNIGCTPVDEPCAQVGQEDYAKQARMGCRALMAQLERAYPCPADANACLYIKSNAHDFGTYCEVEVEFDPECPISNDWAYLLEASLPEQWDEAAVKHLREQGYRHLSTTVVEDPLESLLDAAGLVVDTFKVDFEIVGKLGEALKRFQAARKGASHE